jgi:hypothetical protein
MMLLTFVKVLSRKSKAGAMTPTQKVLSFQISKREIAQTDSSASHVSRSLQKEQAKRELKAWPYFYLPPHP